MNSRICAPRFALRALWLISTRPLSSFPFPIDRGSRSAAWALVPTRVRPSDRQDASLSPGSRRSYPLAVLVVAIPPTASLASIVTRLDHLTQQRPRQKAL